MRKIALITGATAGIGRAMAMKLADNQYDLILLGRRAELLQQLKAELGIKCKSDVYVLPIDIRDRETLEAGLNNLPSPWRNIDLLVNNAGLAAGLDPVYEGNTEDWDQMIDTNIKGVLYISRIISQWMIERKKGHIVNISSIAGKEVYPKGFVYCGTKHAIEAITQGLRIDLAPYGIKVSSISPGMVNTEFSLVRFKGDKEKADQVYEGVTPLFAEDIAEALLFVVTRPSHVNINDIYITPLAQAGAAHVFRK